MKTERINNSNNDFLNSRSTVGTLISASVYGVALDLNRDKRQIILNSQVTKFGEHKTYIIVDFNSKEYN